VLPRHRRHLTMPGSSNNELNTNLARTSRRSGDRDRGATRGNVCSGQAITSWAGAAETIDPSQARPAALGPRTGPAPRRRPACRAPAVWRHVLAAWPWLITLSAFGLLGYNLLLYAALEHADAFSASLVNASPGPPTRSPDA